MSNGHVFKANLKPISNQNRLIKILRQKYERKVGNFYLIAEFERLKNEFKISMSLN